MIIGFSWVRGETRQHLVIRTSRIDVDRTPGCVIENQDGAHGPGLDCLFNCQGDRFQWTRRNTSMTVEGCI
jgi:hypothetical protein